MSDRIVESCKANATELVLEVHRLAHTYGDVDALTRGGSGGPRRRSGGAARPERCRQDHPRAHRRHAASSPTTGRSWCAGRTPPRRQRRCGLISGSLVSSRRWTSCSPGRENLVLIGRLYGISRERLPCSRRRAARADRPHRGGRSPGEHVLGRDAPPPRPRGDADRRTIVAAARRTHHRPRPAQPSGTVGPHRRHRTARHRACSSRARTSRRSSGSPTASIVLDNGEVIADDRPQTLRRRIGGQVLDVGVDAEDLDAAAKALCTAGFDVQPDREGRRMTAATTDGIHAAAEAARSLYDAQTEPSEFALRMPSLEEVFLTLTGTAIERDDGNASVRQSRCGARRPFGPAPSRPDRRRVTSPSSSAATGSASCARPSRSSSPR